MDTVQCASSAQARSLCCYHFSVFRIHPHAHPCATSTFSPLEGGLPCANPHIQPLVGGESTLCQLTHSLLWWGWGWVSPVPFCKDEVWKGCRVAQ